ncbi:hypothetical protein BOH66_01420 [Microbacterium aurum]|uniref:Uncharacterized protein n=1 Tax=Microbacterium aurum TaxID=36805 RepID=A0A1P8U4R0_9MICO|nr:hypothetical protein BOH66_01420 [Microbacterium aurum]
MLFDLDRGDGAVLGLGDDDEVEQVDRSGGDQVGQRGDHGGRGSVAVEAHEVQLDGSESEVDHGRSFLSGSRLLLRRIRREGFGPSSPDAGECSGSLGSPCADAAQVTEEMS